jgi:hypothetical protein
MADAYPLTLCKEIESDRKKVTVVGNVEGTFDRGVFISDNTGKCKVIGVPKSVNGLIEVWGEVNRNFEIESRGYSTFKDQNFDFEAHAQLIEYMRQFQDLN